MNTSRRAPLLTAGLAVAAALATTAVGVPQAAAATTPACTPICVLDARVGAHAAYDRVVFDLSAGTMPKARVTRSTSGSYSTPSGQDQLIEIAGKSYLILDLSIAHAHDNRGINTYTSPRVQAVNLPSVKGVQLLNDAQGHVLLGISLNDHSRYKTYKLAKPNRLVVDVYH
ncbi:hypothetical protein [Streptomyces sp. ODS05-4]|uniref:AMIN-like domain-containing (lipo)protein n=1 Tax=Streptomyces sp. ODS05-4 TaxID=2944939 RepID=UPI00210E1801|nr:hypothetical protein [Streptomyces sp. ODS05-4]